MAGFRKLERVVLLVDVQHLISQAPGYPAAIEALARRVLETGTPHTLWAFKLFDSSLSSVASSSRIISWAGKGATRSHFSSKDESDETLGKLRGALEKIMLRSKGGESGGELEHVANACLEAVSDFSWNPLFLRDESSSGGDLYWPESNLLLVLSSAPASWSSSSKLGVLSRFLVEKTIHACWVLPPLERIPEGFMSSEEVSRTWSFACMDDLMLSSMLLSTRLMIPFIAQPSTPEVEFSPIQARLQVRIQGQLQHICRVEVRPFFSESCMQLRSSKKVRVTLAGVVPRKNLSFRTKEVYLLHQQGSGAAENLPETLIEELVRRLGVAPACRQPELKLMIQFLSSLDGVGLVNVELADENIRRCVQGVLEPYTPVSARLAIVDDPVWFIGSGERDEKPSRKRNPVELGVRRSEAWARCLELLQTEGSGGAHLRVSDEELYREYKCTKPLRAWNKQIRQRFKCSMVEFNRWIGRDAAGVSKPAGEEVDARESGFTGSNSLSRGGSLSELNGGDASKEKLSEPEASSQMHESPDLEPVSREGNLVNREGDRSRQGDPVSREEALKYLLSVKEQLGSSNLRSMDVRRLVAESVEALKCGEEEKWYQQLKKLLLQSSKKLSSKYQKPEEAKIWEYAFQVKLRLEILLATQLKQDESLFVDQICDLLSIIQFDHPGGIQDLEETIFENRYKQHLAEIVREIYTRMELEGYCETEVEMSEEMRGDESMEAMMKESEEKMQAVRGKIEKARRNSYFSGRPKMTRLKLNSSIWSQMSGCSQEEEIFVAPTPASKRELDLKKVDVVEATPPTGSRRRPALGVLDHNLLRAKRKCF